MGAGALKRGLSGLWLWLVVAVAGGVMAATCAGQDLSVASVRGELRDARGIRLPGAGLRLISRDTGLATYARTDKHGQFSFLALPPGRYVGSVQLPMAPFWVGRLSLPLEAGEAAGITLRMRSGDQAISIFADKTEEDGSPEIGKGAEPQRKEVSRAGGDKKSGRPPTRPDVTAGSGAGVGPLPVPGREWEALEEVSSAMREGTLADGGLAQGGDEGQEQASTREERETGSAATGLSADGLPVMEDASRVDGLSTEQGFRAGPRGTASGGPRAGSGFAQGAVGRLRLMPRTYSALAGGAGGGVRSVASRGVEARAIGLPAGLHGDVFFKARESAWAAVNPYAVVTTVQAGVVQTDLARPADSDLQFGGAVGRVVRLPGLPRRWSLGVFGAGEVRERREALFSSPETAGFYLLSATQKALLANRGVRSAEMAAALGYLSGLSGPETLHGVQGLGFGRVDLAPGRADRLSAAYQVLQSGMPVTDGGQVAEGVVSRAVGSVGTSAIDVRAGTVTWQHTFGPRWVNALRVQAARDVEAEAPGPGSADVPAIGPGGFAPQVTIGPQGFSYGTPASLGRVAYPDEGRMEVAESSTWRFGRHLVTAGGDWSRLDDTVLGTTNREGSFLYDSGTTGGHAGGLVDWITDYTFNVQAYPNGGCPSLTAKEHFFCFRSYAQSFANAEVEFVTHEVAGFAEDAVRLGPGLQITMGARWEYQLLPFPLAPNVALDAGLVNAGVPGKGPGAGGTTASYPEDRNNVGPRVSLRWSPGAGGGGGRQHSWLTMEAGYGMFFGRLPGATLNAALTETGTVKSTTSVRITPTVETECPQVANQGFGYPCAFLYAPAGVAAVAQTGAATVFSRNFRLPVVQRASFAVERELGRRVFLRGEYATAWATQLPETTDLNLAPSTATVSYVLQGGDGQRGLWNGETFQVPLYTARRTTKFGPVTSIESNANATYHGGTAEVVLRPWHGWGGRAGYTYSKAIDYGPQMGPTPRQDGQFDPFTDGYDKGVSSLDRPWGAAGAMAFRSSWSRGGEWGRQLLEGWGLAAIGRAGSGAPYSYTVFGGTRLNGGHESINGSGGATYLPTVGRNTLRLPMRSKLDLRASREVRLGRRDARMWDLEARADVFNALNTVSLSRVETRAFVVGTDGSVGGMTPLVFQSAAAVASEGVSTPAFGTPLSSTTGLSRERTMELGVKLSF